MIADGGRAGGFFFPSYILIFIINVSYYRFWVQIYLPCVRFVFNLITFVSSVTVFFSPLFLLPFYHLQNTGIILDNTLEYWNTIGHILEFLNTFDHYIEILEFYWSTNWKIQIILVIIGALSWLYASLLVVLPLWPRRIAPRPPHGLWPRSSAKTSKFFFFLFL